MITLTTRLAIDGHVRFRRFDHEGIVINQNTAEALVISDVGTRLLEMADGARTLRECAAILGAEFDADLPTIEHDVIHFAVELLDAGIAAVV